MCGIYGQISGTPARIDSGLAIRHRGPDDAGNQVFPISGTPSFVSLVHRRLSIIDLSPAGHQPMSNEDGTVWIIFNGEIYNFQEIRDELLAAGHNFRSRTDTETIIHGYEEWGDEVISRLRGMFAFAIWDAPQRRLLLARDRIGKKPLFYFADRERFFFGSEIKALLASGEVPAVWDPVAIHDYLTYLYFPAPRTAFKGIRRVPPATKVAVTVDASGEIRFTQETYWDPAKIAASRQRTSYREAIQEATELMDESVKLRLISDVPLGIFLSGGLDSGTITAFAAKNSSKPVKTFSIGFKENNLFDEIEEANLVARKFGTDHQVLRIDAHCASHMPTVVRHFDEPFGNPTAILEYILTQKMREHVTVALSGDGGDEAFGGYVRYAGAWLAEKWRRLPQFVTTSFSRPADFLRDSTSGRHYYRRLREFLSVAWMPQDEMYLNWVGYFSEQEKRAMYTPDFLGLVSERDSGDFLRQLFAQSEALDPLNRLGYVDIWSFLAGNCLEYADRMSMANSLEVRCPFTDHHIIELGLSLPFDWKYRPGKTKRIVRDAMRGVLPDQVLSKKKMGFNPPMPEWIGRELKPLIGQLLSPDAVRRRGIFRPQAVGQLLADHFNGKRDNALKIWSLVMLELWCQMYLDKSPVEGLEVFETSEQAQIH